MSKVFNVTFKYYSRYNDESENHSLVEVEPFEVDTLDTLLRKLGIIKDLEIYVENFNNTKGENTNAQSGLIESGREVLSIKDNSGDIVWEQEPKDETIGRFQVEGYFAHENSMSKVFIYNLDGTVKVEGILRDIYEGDYNNCDVSDEHSENFDSCAYNEDGEVLDFYDDFDSDRVDADFDCDDMIYTFVYKDGTEKSIDSDDWEDELDKVLFAIFKADTLTELEHSQNENTLPIQLKVELIGTEYEREYCTFYIEK